MDTANEHRRKKRPNLTLPLALDPSVLDQPPTSSLPQTISINGEALEINISDLEPICQLGQGKMGVIEKVRHRASDHTFAVKHISHGLHYKDNRRLLDEFREARKLSAAWSPFLIDVYGILQKNDNAVIICMEVIDLTLERLIQYVYDRGDTIPQSILCIIASSVLRGCEWHQSQKLFSNICPVTPSSVFFTRSGRVLMKSVPSLFAGAVHSSCNDAMFYFAPERIENDHSSIHRANVWSFGLTMYKSATGIFPYVGETVFDKIKAVLTDDPPTLPTGDYHSDFEDFINCCLQKEKKDRKTYGELLDHPFITKNTDIGNNMADYVNGILQDIDEKS